MTATLDGDWATLRAWLEDDWRGTTIWDAEIVPTLERLESQNVALQERAAKALQEIPEGFSSTIWYRRVHEILSDVSRP